MSEKPAEWMPVEQWEALVRGDACPLCAECQDSKPINKHGYSVADLHFSRLRLSANQYVAGYCVLICKRHVKEPYNLTDEEQSLFFQDLMDAGRAIEQVFHPIKMNFKFLGNLVPHLHVHIEPRYYGDPAPGRPIDNSEKIITLTPQEYQERINKLKEALGRG